MKKQELEKLLIKKGYYRLEDVEAQKDIWLLYDWCKPVEVPFDAKRSDIVRLYHDFIDNSVKADKRANYYNPEKLPLGFTYAEKLELEYAELLSE